MQLQGRIQSRYHPDYPLKREITHSTSNKVLPCNGGFRVSLLAFALTRPTREEEVQAHPYRLAPNADSLQHLKME